jgi:hypothetical protein
MSGLITGLVGLGLSVGTTAASFIQAGNQKRKQQDFEADAAKALAEARQRLQVNYAEAMSVNKEPYNQERLAMLSAGAQIAQAASESKRGVSAAAGQLLASQQAGQQDISNRQGTDMQNIQNAILEEESRLRDVNVGLDVQELAGNQQAAADARLASQMAKQQGIQGIGNFAQQGLTMIPLYGGIGKGAGNAAGNLTAEAAANPNVVSGDNIAKSMGTPQTLPSLNQGNTIQNKKDLIGQQILGAEAFISPEQAASAGYVYDSTLGGYVLINKNINASLTNPTPNSSDAFNLNLGG